MENSPLPSGDLAALWSLKDGIDYLNHGSFGACPKEIVEAQQRWRDRLEQSPWRFQVVDLPALMREARRALAGLVGVDDKNLVFVQNATQGVNTVLRSLAFSPGDEIIMTQHEYFACQNALRFVASHSGARVVVAQVPFPIEDEAILVETILRAVTPATRLLLIDHITSPTALVFPVERIVREMTERGIDTLVDGAHAPGHVPLNLEKMGAAYYTGNCHKWLCTPKSAAFLYIRPDRQDKIHPLVISRLGTGEDPKADLELEFSWAGTQDHSAWLCIPEAIQYMGALVPGGWPAIMQINHQLAVKAREHLCRALEIEAPCPEEMLGAMASLPIPPNPHMPPKLDIDHVDEFQESLFQTHRIDVPVVYWPAPPARMLRISAQLYNREEQYLRLAQILEGIK